MSSTFLFRVTGRLLLFRAFFFVSLTLLGRKIFSRRESLGRRSIDELRRERECPFLFFNGATGDVSTRGNGPKPRKLVKPPKLSLTEGRDINRLFSLRIRRSFSLGFLHERVCILFGSRTLVGSGRRVHAVVRLVSKKTVRRESQQHSRFSTAINGTAEKQISRRILPSVKIHM